eukprot:5352430-Amphidinium_carterae.1
MEYMGGVVGAPPTIPAFKERSLAKCSKLTSYNEKESTPCNVLSPLNLDGLVHKQKEHQT